MKGVFLTYRGEMTEIEYENINDFYQFFNREYFLVSSYSFDDETVDIYGYVNDNDINFNFNILPYFFNLRYISSPLIIICRDNETNDFTDFTINDYEELKHYYDTDEEDSTYTLETEDNEMDISDDYDFDDSFIENDFVDV